MHAISELQGVVGGNRASLDAHEALLALHSLLDSCACIIVEELPVTSEHRRVVEPLRYQHLCSLQVSLLLNRRVDECFFHGIVQAAL